jgi:hypothetical protein
MKGLRHVELAIEVEMNILSQSGSEFEDGSLNLNL